MLLLDASRLRSSKSGLGRFANNVARALDSLGTPFKVLQAAPVIDVPSERIIQLPNSIASGVGLNPLRAIRWKLHWKHAGLDLCNPILSVSHNPIPGALCQAVVVHDWRPRQFPDNPIQGLYWKFILPLELRRANVIATVSRVSQAQTAKIMNFDLSEIPIIPNQLPELASNGEKIHDICDYFLMVGSNWTHKNLEWVLFRVSENASIRLKVVCAETPYIKKCKCLSDRLGLQSRVDFLFGVNDCRLRELYSHCRALIFPSLDEGFGIPPFEAISANRPVICSDIPVLREIYGSMPIYFAIGDSEGFHNALRFALDWKNYDEISLEMLRNRYSALAVEHGVRKVLCRLKISQFANEGAPND